MIGSRQRYVSCELMFMDGLVSLQVFRAIAELRSFSAAAERRSLSTAMASKHVAALENRLGTRLFHRTSRHVSLTEMGAMYLEQVRRVLDGLDEAHEVIRQ